ncbi:hypothetical protein JCM13304A_04540 [Desulfothermus okinawensis JCM 13304]
MLLCILFFINGVVSGKLSDESATCISCHGSIYPGIVSSWKSSKHSKAGIGCFECHGKNNENHKDAFEHNGFNIHTVVTPGDCSRCHKTEASQYSENMMSFIYDNLMKNRVYKYLEKNINFRGISRNQISMEMKDIIRSDSCLYYHGTRIEVTGWEQRNTMFGDLRFPQLEGWPNQGVGRLNPDRSRGSCTCFHPRHSFSVEIARKPYSCAQCHKGPDVPVYKVY